MGATSHYCSWWRTAHCPSSRPWVIAHARWQLLLVSMWSATRSLPCMIWYDEYLSTPPILMELRKIKCPLHFTLFTTVSTFLDMTVDFDSVKHSILPNKLKTYWIRGKELSWIRPYLKGWQQYDNIKHKHNNRLYDVRS